MLCRFRGYVEDGYDFDTNTPNSIRGVKYWQVQTARLAFVLVFEVIGKCANILYVLVVLPELNVLYSVCSFTSK